MSAPRVVFLIGPTAVGKTDLSLELAARWSAEIVSADSRQIYRYMDIGTAKPGLAELRRIVHHFIDIKNPDDYYSAGDYGREARSCIQTLQAAGRNALVVGGSGFYIQALVSGLFAPPVTDAAVKEKWRQAVRDQGAAAVFDYLRKVDPVSAGRLHVNDTQRIVRALEVYDLTGEPISSFRTTTETTAAFSPVYIGLDRPRPVLYQRIETRVDEMLAGGLLDEVRGLQERGWDLHLNALRTVGYSEVFRHFSGELNYDEMVHLIKQNSRHYAKRQLTWFRKNPAIAWFDLEKSGLAEIVKFIEEFPDTSKM